ncbi:hypothetical protein X961_3080 [Burkholderia pseudomallei MSHR5613]|nr:hypothetical protein DO73_2689 [Burkholderia pseudomallei]KGR98288.1 hypothetical protein X948_4133 [Burkholderia pseudomallei MSHR5608]KGS03323.1 hypothetical protein X977_4304 [Burkholderia pseudomallei MSHR7504]KGS18775.1 hypothetical protein X989_4409 [Burkholderia pseudomallei MSHR4378]KGS29385.1 hypothetical protein X962_3204 [Burkholderia pseudomallei MSHR7343]KGS29984.1 hypothetical protein X941_3092 [Burkholderia pseudomallei MSHR5569]KGS45664.1 hypothetical protein X945_2743 [Bur
MATSRVIADETCGRSSRDACRFLPFTKTAPRRTAAMQRDSAPTRRPAVASARGEKPGQVAQEGLARPYAG